MKMKMMQKIGIRFDKFSITHDSIYLTDDNQYVSRLYRNTYLNGRRKKLLVIGIIL